MNIFFDTLRKLFAPSVNDNNLSDTSLFAWRFPLARRMFQLVTWISMPAILASTYYAFDEGTYSYIPIYIGMVTAMTVIAFWKRVTDTVRMWGLMVLIYFVVVLDFYTEGRGSLARSFILVFTFLGAIYFGRRGAIFAAVLGLLTMGLFAYLFTANILPDYQVTSTTIAGWTSNTVILAVLISVIVYSVNFLVSEMTRLLAQSQELNQQLEQRVAERTTALETSAEVSRRLASILDPIQLTSAVVNEVRNAYDYYYAQIYLFDDSGENLVLTAGTGEAGEAMLKRGHSLPRGRGLVGRAAESNESILVPDTAQDSNWLPNDLLPDTKAEAAIPITIGGQVLGVLDVQDDVTNDINPSDITLLTSLANQVAVSLNNARQYQQAQSLREQYALAVESSNDGIWDWDIANDSIYYSARWKAMLGFEEQELTRGFVEWEDRIHPEDRDYATKSLEDYLAQRAPAYDVEVRLQHKDGTWRWIRDRGKALRHPDGTPYRMAGSHSDITERKQLEELNAQRARQQEAINMITQKIQATTTIEEAMQITARELGHALGMKSTQVTLEPNTKSANTESAS